MDSGSPAGIDEVVADAWCAALGSQSLPPNANIFLMGGDSLTAVMVAADLAERLGVEITLSDLLDAPHFDEFVGRVAELVTAAGKG